MNKNLKRIIALALVFGTVSVVSPAANLNLLTTKAYASTSTNDHETLDSLKLEDSNGSSIRLYDSSSYSSSGKVDSSDVSDGGTYYAKTSSDTISINTTGPSSRYVRVFKGTSSSTKGKSEGSNISLSTGINTIVVRVYDTTPDSSVTYDDDSYVSEYTIKVKRTTNDTTDTSTSNSTDAIYLDALKVNGVSVGLTKSKTSYDIAVKESYDQVTITAEPEDSSYDVIIDGTSVDDSDNYKNDVNLNDGKNAIKVKVEYDGKERDYTLNITRGTATTSDSSTSTNTSTNTATTQPSTTDTVSTGSSSAIKPNQWVQVSGVWRYNDQYGNAIRNAWHYDGSIAYYLDENCNMATDWKQINGAWYYFGNNGARVTSGWQLVGSSWYYFDSEGKMVTGWIKDNGKYYYLNSNGTMASNTTIGVYKLGSDGAWVG